MSAVEYAEQKLGVHAVYEEAIKLQEQLDDMATHLDKAQDTIREVSGKILDRETDVYLEERSRHAEQSATWLKEHVKHTERKDPELIRLRAELEAAQSNKSGLEYDWEVLKSQLRILEARMHELGGYLHFLAVAKQAELYTQTQENPKDSDV